MDKIAKPTPEALRKAQAALDALNSAYEYFAPLPYVAKDETADYVPYVKAA